MPFGEYQYSVDDKGRVIVPPPFRNFIEDGMVVTRGMEGCLYIFRLGDWDRIEKSLTDLPIIDAESRKFVRFFYSGAAKAKIDSAGRITLARHLARVRRHFVKRHRRRGTQPAGNLGRRALAGVLK